MNSTQKILLIGHTGFLGSSLLSLLPSKSIEVKTVDRKLFDLSRPLTKEFQTFMIDEKFNYVIVAAAISDVEKSFKERELSDQVNVHGTQQLFELAKKCETIPIFFSSDYVFSGGTIPYTENDIPKPLTIYGQQKLTIEKYLTENFSKYLIFRTSKLMSKTAHPRNILIPVLQSLKQNKPIDCFVDQYLNPVFVEDIASLISKSFEENLSGTFHLGTRKIFSRFELATFLAGALGLNESLIRPINMSDIKFSEVRPTHNLLNCHRLESELDFKFCEIEDAIDTLKHLLEKI